MLFPFCNPSDSGIDGDHCMSYFLNVSVFTNMYAMWKGAGSRYRHDFTPILIPELVHWTGVPLCNEALDGKHSTLFHRWWAGDPRYNQIIANNITKAQWKTIKWYFKLSMGIEEPKKGSPAYDPCAKYDYIYCCLIHNMEYVTNEADADATIDKMTWGFCGYSGKVGGRLMNKPQSKGGQSTIVIDINQRYPRAYHHQHSLQTPASRPTGFS